MELEETGGLEQHAIYGLKRTWQLIKNEVEREGRHVHCLCLLVFFAHSILTQLQKSLANLSNAKDVGVMMI